MNPKADVIFTSIPDDREEQAQELTRELLSSADIIRVSEHQLHIILNNTGYLVDIRDADYDNHIFVFSVNGREVRIRLRDEVESRVHAMGFDANRNHAKLRHVVSPMPGLVLKVLVKVGDVVAEGDPVIVLEAMKMENVLSAPRNGVVTGLHVREKQNVDKNQVLIDLDDPA